MTKEQIEAELEANIRGDVSPAEKARRNRAQLRDAYRLGLEDARDGTNFFSIVHKSPEAEESYRKGFLEFHGKHPLIRRIRSLLRV